MTLVSISVTSQIQVYLPLPAIAQSLMIFFKSPEQMPKVLKNLQFTPLSFMRLTTYSGFATAPCVRRKMHWGSPCEPVCENMWVKGSRSLDSSPMLASNVKIRAKAVLRFSSLYSTLLGNIGVKVDPKGTTLNFEPSGRLCKNNLRASIANKMGLPSIDLVMSIRKMQSYFLGQISRLKYKSFNFFFFVSS